MKTTHTDEKMLLFYQNIGKVFYAVAAADGNVNEAEVKTLTEIIQRTWKNVEDTFDQYGEDSAFQIQSVFDWLTDNQVPSDQLISEFEEYKKAFPSLFSEKVNKLIIQTCHHIAASFSGKNKAELVAIAKINDLLK